MTDPVKNAAIREYDTAVIGGGTAGVIAALQAAREGIRVLLVEKNGMLGGTLGAARVNYPGMFYAWKKPIIAGIGWELVKKCVEEAGMTFPDFSVQKARPNSKWQVRVDPYLYSLLCSEAAAQAGVEVSFDTMLAGVDERTEPGFKIVTLCTKEGLTQIRTRILIDCTGDASAVRLAGYELVSDGETQPATHLCRVTDYDPEGLDYDAIGAAFDEEVAAGRMKYTDVSWKSDHFEPKWFKRMGGSSNHISLPDADASTSAGKSRYILESHRSLLRVYRFLRRQPGAENVRFTDIAPECGIRETVRIRGKKTVVADDYLKGVRYGDDVCYTFYPIDLHTMEAAGTINTHLEEGIVPTIPRGAMLPEGSRNFLAAGRIVASDRASNSAIRVQSTCMAEGQAAGALAVLAVRLGVDVEDVPMEALRELLERHGAIVP